LSLSSTWQAGDSGGDFAWSYGMRVPPVPGDLVPEVSLSYSSGAVDGQVASRNVQPSWLGEGWNFHPGYIERTYRPCKDDVATGEEVRLYRGNGTGGFAGGFSVVLARLDTDGAVFTPGDLSGDGEPDVIFRDGTDKTLWLARGDGSSGWITESGVLDAGDWSAAQFLFSPGDFSGDGHPDIMWRNASNALMMRRGTAAGGLESTSVQVGTSFGGANAIFSPGDFNGDGHGDVLWRRSSDAALMALYGNGAGGWISGTSVVVGTSWGAANLFTGGDFSGDGHGDVVIRKTDNNLYLYKGNGSGGWINPSGTQIGTGWSSFQALLVASDVDGDGDADILGSKPSAANPTFTNATADLCWRQDNARLVWGGKSTDLVLGADGTWRAEADDGAKVELRTDTTNGDNNGEYWRLTTVDGTEFSFGRNRLPNWTTGKRETNAAWTVPVFANHNPGDPCFSAAGFASSRCNQAYRWNLDYVVDPADNSMAYFYTKEQFKTALAGNANSTIAYTRGGWLDHIEYGMRAGSELATTTPPAKVVFGVAERCLSSCWTGTPFNSAANTANWPDTPWDLHCANSATSCPNNMSPSFFNLRRLTSVTTQIWSGSGATYTDVDTWTLTHQFPATGNSTSPVLWLASITHTGKVGGTAALPAVTFGGVRYDNRAFFDPTVGVAQPRKWRVQTVDTEAGGEIEVTYAPADSQCLLGAPIPDPENNTRRCFAQWISPDDAPPGWSWWHKYIVSAVKEKDLVGGSPDVVHAYAYATTGSNTAVLWAHDDGADLWSTPLPRRSWGDWRGYPTVTVTTGPSGGTQTQTVNRYFRGLDGDYTAQGKRRTATITNSAGEVTTDHSAYGGRLHETIELDGPGGAQLRRTIMDPVRHQTGQRTIDEAWAIPTKQTSDIVRTARERVYTWLAATSSWRQVETANTWHPTYGILTQVDDLGDTATASDDRCTRYTYAPNTASYLVDYPSTSDMVGVACATTPNLPADALGAARYFYDGATSHGTPPTVGNVTKTEHAASYTGSTPNWVKTATSGFDVYGRVTSAGDALDRITTTAYTHAANGLLASATQTNPATHQQSTTFAQTWGVPLTVTDPNGKVTTGAYDPLGRMTKVWLPGRATNLTGTVEYDYSITKTGPSWIATKALGPNGNQITSYEIFDGLLRPRQTQTPTAVSIGGRLINETRYDGRGLTATDSRVWNNASGPTSTLVTFADADVGRQQRYTYDGLKRPTTAQVWSLGSEQWRTTTAHEGDRAHVTPPAGGTATTTIADARGRTTELRQYTTAGTPTGAYQATTYTYDLLDRLRTATDTAGNDWGWTYDLLGRLTQTTDPDKGTASSTYDNAGQLLTSTDARNITLAYAYDNLGRTTSLWRDAVGTGTKRAEWTYDTLADSTPVKGHPVAAIRWVGTDAYRSEVTGYDNRYRPLGTKVTFPASTGPLATQGPWTSTTTYHVDGSLAAAALPAGAGLSAETIAYSYDTNGYLTSTVGLDTYLASQSYYSWGDPFQAVRGTGTKRIRQTFSVEEATGRLTGIALDTENETTPGSFVSRRTDTYAYQPSGLLASTSEVVDGVAHSVQCFTYDRLARLTEAFTQTTASCPATPAGGNPTGQDPYWTGWQHDAVGNRTQQTRHGLSGATDTVTTYTHPTAGGIQPHALSSSTTTGPGAGSTSYGYDSTGNTTTRTLPGSNQTLDWDAEGHLATHTINGQTTEYLYAPDGARLLRTDPDGSVTAYLGTQEVKKSPSGTLSATRYYGTYASRTATGLAWLSADHHGTATTSIDATSLATSTRRTMPYGEDRGSQPLWPNERGFVGGAKDPTGLIHLGAREYDSSTGRFISVDPVMDLRDPQQWQPYVYANNNPTTYSDPSGRMRLDAANMAGGVSVAGSTTVMAQHKSVWDSVVGGVATGFENVVNSIGQPVRSSWDLFNKQKTAVQSGEQSVWDAAKEAAGHYAGLACAATFCGPFAAAEAAVNLTTIDKDASLEDGIAAIYQAAVIAVSAALPVKIPFVKGRPTTARNGCSSFSASTPVLLADGSTKPIAAIQVGDVVLATNPETGETSAETVTAAWVHDDILVDLLVGSTALSTTEDHVFWNATDQQWQEAHAFDPGDTLLTPTGEAVTVAGLAWATTRLAPAYNLTVDDLHTYYVIAGDTPVLVHNDGGVWSWPNVDGPIPQVGQTALYAQWRPGTRQFLKWGIWTNTDGKYMRYPQWKLLDDEVQVTILKNFDSKMEAHAVEYELISRAPGPRNDEQYAGKKSTGERPTDLLRDIQSVIRGITGGGLC
jgi:RHS repeat-associated protein